MANNNDDYGVIIQAVLAKNGINADLKEIQQIINKHSLEVALELKIAPMKNNFKKVCQEMANDFNKTFNTNISGKDIFKAYTNQIKQTKNELKKLSSTASNIKIKLDNGDFDSQIATLQSKFEKLGLSETEVKTKMQEVNETYAKLTSSKSDKDIVANNKKFVQSLSKANNEAKILKTKLEQTYSATKQTSLSNNIQNWLTKNTKATKQARQELQEYYKELSSGKVSLARIEEIKQRFDSLDATMRTSKKLGKSTISSMTTEATKFARWTLVSGTLMSVFNAFTKVGDAVVDVDGAMTSLYKVTDETSDSYSNFLDSASNKAEELGQKVSSLVEQTAEWAKLGYDLNEASELAQASSVYSNVGEMSNKDSASSIVTAIKSFNLEAKDSMNIVSSLNELGNKFAVDSAQLGYGLQNSASALSVAGNNINETLALLTGGGEITQNVQELGNALKVSSMRILSQKGALQELGEEYEDIESISKTQQKIYSLTNKSVNIFDDNGNFKSTYTILSQISEVIDDLSDPDRAELLETLFGKQRINQGTAVIKAFQSGQVQKAYETAINSEGSAMREQERWLDSIEGKTNQLDASFQKLATHMVDSEAVKDLIDTARTGLDTIDSIVNKTGMLLPLLATASTFFTMKGNILFGISDNQWTLFGKSIKDINTSLATTFTNIKNGDFSSLFTKFSKVELTDDLLGQFTKFQDIFNNTNKSAQVVAEEIGNVDESIVNYANSCKNGEMSQKGFETAIASTGTKAKLTTVALNTMSVALNFGIMFAITEGIQLLSEFSSHADDLADSAQEIGSSFTETESSITDYKSKIEELYATINNSHSSITEVTDARKNLMSIQDELIDKFGDEKGAIENITTAIDGQTDSLDKLTQQQYNIAKTKFISDNSGFVDSVTNFFNGNDSSWDAMIDEMENRTDKLNQDIIIAFDRQENKQVAEAFKTAFKNNGFDSESFKMTGTAEELKDFVEELTKINEQYKNMSSKDGYNEINTELAKMSTNLNDTIDKNKELYQSYVLYEKIFANDSYKEYYNDLTKAQSKYQEAYESGNTNRIKSAGENYARLLSDSMDKAIDNGDNNIADYFKNLYPELETIVSSWQFKVNFQADTSAFSKAQELGEKYKASDLLNMINTNGVQEGENEFDILIDKAVQYGLCIDGTSEEVQKLIDVLVSMGIVQDDLTQKVDTITDSYINFDEAIESSKVKDDLIDIAKAGELTPEVLSSNDDYKSILTQTGLTAEKVCEKVKELVTANERLADMSSDLNNVASAYKEMQEYGFAYAETLDGLGDQFKKLDSYEKFVETVGSNLTSKVDKQNAFNELVTEYMSSEQALEKLNKENESYYVNQLKEMGVTNAQSIVTDALTAKMQALALQEQALTIYKKGVTSSTIAEVEQLLNEANACDTARLYLFNLVLQEEIFNCNGLDVADKIKNLSKLAKAYGVTSETLEYYNKLANLSDEDKNRQGVQLRATDLNQIQADIEKQINNAIYKKTKVNYSGINTKDAKTKKTDTKTKETFDWIEVKLKRLSEAVDQFKTKAEQTFRSLKNRADNYKSAISATTAEIKGQNSAYTAYIKKANAVGLSKSWRTKVQNGSYSISTITDDNLKEKIKNYQDFYNKAQDCKNSIQDLVNNIYEYAEALANLPLDKASKKIEAYNDKIDISKSKADISNSYQSKNAQLSLQTSYYKSIAQANKEAVEELNDEINSYWSSATLKSARKSKTNKSKTKGQKLSTSGFDVSSNEYKAIVQYNSAIEAKTEATNNATKSTNEYTKALKENKKAQYDNISAYYDAMIKSVSAKTSKAQTYLDYRSAMGYSNISTDQVQALKDVKTYQSGELSILQQERSKYNLGTLEKQFKNGLLSYEDYKSQYEYIIGLDEQILKKKSNISETTKEINKIPLTKIGYELDALTSKSDKLQKSISLKEAKGLDIAESDYMSQFDNNTQTYKKYTEQLEELKKLQSGVSTYSDDWIDYQSQIDSTENSMSDLLISNEELKDSVRNLDFEQYTKFQDQIENTIDSLDKLAGLIDDDSLYNDDGSFSDMGVTKLALLRQSLGDTYKEIASVQNQIDEYESKYRDFMNGVDNGYSEKEYTKDIQNATSLMFDLLSQSKSTTKEITSMFKDQIDSQIDSLSDLIDAWLEAYKKQQDYYDYDKQIRAKNKTIQEIQTEITATEAMADSLEKRKKLLELQAQLSEAKDDLESTQREHESDLLTNTMNDWKESLEEKANVLVEKVGTTLESQTQLLGETNNICNTYLSTISDTLSKIVTFYSGGATNTLLDVTNMGGFANGGVVTSKDSLRGVIKRNGDSLLASVNAGESIMTREFTDLLPTAINSMNGMVRLYNSDLSSIGSRSVNSVGDINIDNLVKVEGNATDETIAKMQQVANGITKNLKKEITSEFFNGGRSLGWR